MDLFVFHKESRKEGFDLRKLEFFVGCYAIGCQGSSGALGGSRVKGVFIRISDESGLRLGQAFIHGQEQYRFRDVTASIASSTISD